MNVNFNKDDSLLCNESNVWCILNNANINMSDKLDVNDITDNENIVLLDILNTYMSALLDLAVDMLEDRKREQKKYTSENIDKFVSTLNTLKDRLPK